MPVMDFYFVPIIGFGYNMTLQVTFSMLITENVFNLVCFCVRRMVKLLKFGDL